MRRGRERIKPFHTEVLRNTFFGIEGINNKWKKGKKKGREEGINVSCSGQEGVNVGCSGQEGVNVSCSGQEGINVSCSGQEGINVSCSVYCIHLLEKNIKF